MRKKTSFLKDCPICGNQFKTYPKRIEKGQGKFCSRKCNLKYRERYPFKPWLGKTRSKETNEKISLKLKGRSLSKETRIKMLGRIPWNKNTKGLLEHSLEWRLKASKRIKGENHWNWQGGISNENERIRKSFEYFLWHEACLERDNYTCVLCGIKRGWDKQLKKRILVQVDHIKSFAAYPELRLALDNGRTLCVECHRNTPNYGYKARFEKVVMPYAY